MPVYRIPDFLEDEQLVHKLNLVNKYAACIHITCGYAHTVTRFLICEQCQKIEAISMNRATITRLRQNVKQAGFHLVSPQLGSKLYLRSLHGRCSLAVTRKSGR